MIMLLISSNVVENTMWIVQSALSAGYSFNYNIYIIGSEIDSQGAGSVIAGPGNYPSAVLINFYYGRNQQKYIQLRIYQTSYETPPPNDCNNDWLTAGGGIAGIIAGIVSIASVAAAPETGGASLAIAAGMITASGGGIAIIDGLKCNI